MKQRPVIKIIMTGLVFLAVGSAAVFFYSLRKHPQSVSDAVHYSYFSQKDFYEEAYGNAALLQPPHPAKGGTPLLGKEGNTARGIIVNHHLLAGSFISETFNAVATDAPVTVLLVSPNHFDAGKAEVITSAEPWQTPYGVLQADASAINKLSEQHLASVEEGPFSQEHGVSGIVAFIKKSLPNAKVVPVIFRNRMALGQALLAADKFYRALPSGTLIVGSFDFSHYLTSAAADFHDIKNLADVESFNIADVYNLDIDSRPGLAFFLQLLKDQGSQNFHLLEHSNSARLTHQDILETTSYIDGYFTSGKAVSSSAQTFLSLPSVVPSAQVTEQTQKNNPRYTLTYLERLFYGQDLTVAFLEKPDPSIPSIFTKLGIEVLGTDSVIKTLGGTKAAIVDCQKGIKGEQGAAREAVDRSADVAVCQGATKNSLEIYKGKPIIYAKEELFKNKSLAVGIAFGNHQLKIFLLPIGPDKGQLKLLIREESGRVLADMAAASGVNQAMKKEIESGEITINN